MDDCNLDKLGIKPGKLSPVFHKDTTEYNVVVGSTVETITFDYLTSDSGASTSISGSEGGKSVQLKEGCVNDIKIEVTAEDGTVKNYFVHIKRLSSKDATLSDLKITGGIVEPEFSPEVLEYYCYLACDAVTLSIAPSSPDPQANILVNGEKPGSAINLSVGVTKVGIEVTSPDGSITVTYQVAATRKQIPRYVKFVDSPNSLQYECPTSLSPLYIPISIKDSNPKHVFSGPLIDEFTKTCKIDPLNESSLPSEWRVEDYNIDKQMSDAMVYVPLANGGKSENVIFRELGTIIKSCGQVPNLGEINVKYDANCAVTHTLASRSWEKQLQQIFDESNAMKLTRMAEESLAKYYTSLPKPGRQQHYQPGESPMDYLEHAIQCYATAIKQKPKDANYHLHLGLVLEERYHAEDTIGLKEKDSGMDSRGFNVEAQESSKEEECAAICQLRGVGAGASLALQLKAIDQEYHHLVGSGQGGKADHVQGLFAWKSKQTTQEGRTAQKAADDQSPLGQAYLKCLDALSLDETKAVYHFHVGRMLVIQGNHTEAVPRLEACLGWNDKYPMARFYLGLALSLKKEGPGSRAKECISYLMETMEALLSCNTAEALTSGRYSERKAVLQSEDLLRNSNVHVLRGLIQLGKLLTANSGIKDIISPMDVFHTAALVASQVLTRVARGDTYQQVEWVLLEAHSQLLELLVNGKHDVSLISQRCERLSALIKHATIPKNAQLLALQEKTSQMLVEIQPCSSHAIYLLGNSQLVQYDNDPEHGNAKQLLADCKLSFLASIELEGKVVSGEMPKEVKDQTWWQDKLKIAEEKKKAEESAKAPAAKTPSARGRGAATAGRGVAARGGATTRGGPAARGAAAAKSAPVRAAPAPRGGRGGPAPARGGATVAHGGAAAARGGPVAARGGAAAARGGKGAAAKPSGSKEHVCAPTARPASAAKTKEEPKKESAEASAPVEPPSKPGAPTNKKTYHPRLGLARALTREAEDLTEATKYYHQVIDMAPEVHDAYVEIAELLTLKDPMGAVDVYCKFPISDNPTFDDAYIFGEVVRLLMKSEKFDDPRLEKNMIAMGRVMGLASLEKYVNILDDKLKSKTLMSVYAGVNKKTVDDPDMQAFFKFKCWI